MDVNSFTESLKHNIHIQRHYMMCIHMFVVSWHIHLGIHAWRNRGRKKRDRVKEKSEYESVCVGERENEREGACM